MRQRGVYPALNAEFRNPVNEALATYGCAPLTPDEIGAPGALGQRIVGLTSHAKRGTGLAEMTLTVCNTAVQDGRRVESMDAVTVRVGRPAAIVVPMLFMGQQGEPPSWHVVFARRHLLGQAGLAWTLPRGRAATAATQSDEPSPLLANRILSEALGQHYINSVRDCRCEDLGRAVIGGEIIPARVLAHISRVSPSFDRRKLNGEVLFCGWKSARLMVSRGWIAEADIIAALYKCECSIQP